MVEFKIDREGNIARLLEVNARFWGSLQLAIAAGVDFPYLLFRMARGEKLEGPVGYRIGLRSRWELGDLDHLLLRLLKNPTALNLPSGIPSRSMLVKEFLFDFFRPSVRNEVLQAGDPSPFLHEMKGYVGSLLH
jgi:predicted ATP-grasp superfamily ATP-dependent carboligase